METKYTEAYEVLKKYNQEHLLIKYDKMTNENKEKLIDEILSIDFKQLNNLFGNIKNEHKNENDIITPIDYIDKDKISKENLEEYNQKGIESIKRGELAIITMAGGQGTRLRT